MDSIQNYVKSLLISSENNSSGFIYTRFVAYLLDYCKGDTTMKISKDEKNTLWLLFKNNPDNHKPFPCSNGLVL